MSNLFKRLNIKIKIAAPFNHQSLEAEHGIKSLSSIMTKHLTEQGQMCPKFPTISNTSLQHIQFSQLSESQPIQISIW